MKKIQNKKVSRKARKAAKKTKNQSRSQKIKSTQIHQSELSGPASEKK